MPWNDVLFVRACTKTSTWGYGSADDGKTPGVLEALEIRYADGRSERISGPPLKTLTRLHALLEPDLDLVVKARSRIAAGEAPELAAKAVGLATRD